MRKVVKIILWVLLILGTVGFVLRLSTGHRLSNLGSYVTWGLQVSTYIYFIGLSAGAFLFSSLVYAFNIKKLKPLGPLTLVLALVTLLAALVSITLDLGHPERFWKLFTSSNFFSIVSWVYWIYVLYFVLLLVELFYSVRSRLKDWRTKNPLMRFILSPFKNTVPDEAKDTKVLKVLSVIGVPVAISFSGGVGAIFGVIIAKPYWYESLFPLMFLVGALLSGTAILLFVVAAVIPRDSGIDKPNLVKYLSSWVLGFLLLEMTVLWAEFSISLYPGLPYGTFPFHALSFKIILFGPNWWVFWIVQILIGILVPLAILIFRRKSVAWLGAGGFIAAGAFISTRFNIVVPGVQVPELSALSSAYLDARLTYSYYPSLVEWSLLAFVIGLAGVLFFFLYENLPIFQETHRR